MKKIVNEGGYEYELGPRIIWLNQSQERLIAETNNKSARCGNLQMRFVAYSFLAIVLVVSLAIALMETEHGLGMALFNAAIVLGVLLLIANLWFPVRISMLRDQLSTYKQKIAKPYGFLEDATEGVDYVFRTPSEMRQGDESESR